MALPKKNHKKTLKRLKKKEKYKKKAGMNGLCTVEMKLQN